MRDKLIAALSEHFKAHIEKHRINIEIMLSNPRGIPEHTDWMDSVEKELEQVAHYDDLLDNLQRYFDPEV
jgi:hypothetical protein